MNNEFQQIIGFDLGHGESALTTTESNADDMPRVLDLGIGKNFITAVAKLVNGEVLIGETAITNTHCFNGEQLWLAFKNSALNEPDKRKPILLFARKILQILQEKHLIKEPAHFVIGCPSGWSSSIREQYARLFNEIGMQSVTIVAESRAAFLEARDSRQISNQDIEGSLVLIIDIGSSTTDFTLIEKLREKYVDFGHNSLGAHLIDKAILKHVLSRSKQKAMLEELFECPFYKTHLEFECRRAKEDYFSKEHYYNENKKTLKKIIYLPDPTDPEEDISVKIILSPEDREIIAQMPVLDNLTWAQLFEKELISVKEKAGNLQPRFILLTGGASRMGFTFKICEQVFPNTVICKGSEPEFSIARGLALAGRIDIKINAFRKETNLLLESDWLKKLVFSRKDNLLNILARKLEEEIENKILIKSFQKWRRSQLNTLVDVENDIKFSMQAFIDHNEITALVESTIITWFNTNLINVLDEQLNPICDKYGIIRSAFHIRINNMKSWTTGLNNASIQMPTNAIGGSISEYIGLAASVIITPITGVLSGGAGIALIMQGPVGWTIGAIVGAMGAYFGGKELTERYIKEMDIPSFIRSFVSEESIRTKIESNRGTVIEGIKTSLKHNDEAIEKLIEGIRQILEFSLKQASEKAALEIY